MANSDDDAWLEEPTLEATDAAINGNTPEAASADAPAAAARAASSGAAKMPPLFEIFQDTEHFQKQTNAAGNKRVLCLWCNKDLTANATKVLFHVCGVRGQGVNICEGAIPPIHKERYLDLLKRKQGQKNKRAGEFLYLLVIIIIIICII